MTQEIKIPVSAETVLSEVVVVAKAKPNVSAAGVTTYRPQISVVLKKVVNRKETAAQDVPVSDRVKQSSKEIDLTAYLGTGSSVTTRRSTREPAGSFSLTFPDQQSPTDKDSIYGLIEPNDIIEIRMCRDISKTDAGAEGRSRIPIVMRGFVTQVERKEAMTTGGPQRTVTISGHDYGKILQILRVFYLPGVVIDQDLLTAFNLAMNYDVEAVADEPAADFLERIVTKIVQQFIDRMKAASGGGGESPIMDITFNSSVTDGVVSAFGTQSWPGGSIWDLLHYYGDVGIWNELYIEDRASGPVLVYRPCPFRTAAGEYIQDGAHADTVEIVAADLVDLTARRTDANTANYFWVDAPRYQLVESPLMRAGQNDGALQPSPRLADYQNSDPLLYGIRLMIENTNQGGRVDGKAEDVVTQGEKDAIAMIAEKRRVLIENNKDNVVLEDGQMVIKGNERVKPGSYVKLTRGKFEASYYAFEVDHLWQFGDGFITTIQYDRGTGFIERLKRSGSAYLDELTIGGSYGA